MLTYNEVITLRDRLANGEIEAESAREHYPTCIQCLSEKKRKAPLESIAFLEKNGMKCLKDLESINSVGKAQEKNGLRFD